MGHPQQQVAVRSAGLASSSASSSWGMTLARPLARRRGASHAPRALQTSPCRSPSPERPSPHAPASFAPELAPWPRSWPQPVHAPPPPPSPMDPWAEQQWGPCAARRPALHPPPSTPPPSLSSAQISARIRAAPTWQSLESLVRHNGPHFNYIHVSNAITHLAHLVSVCPPCVPTTSAPSSSSSSSSSLPRPSSRPVPPEAYTRLMDSLLHLVRAHMHAFGARQSANTLWALAQLHPTHPGCHGLMLHILPLMRSLLPWCEPQHLSCCVLAAAHSGLFLEDDWVEAFLECSETEMPRFAPRELANTLWALASLGIAPDAAWLDAYFDRLAVALPLLAPLDVSQIMYSLACLGLRPRAPAHADLLARVCGSLLQHRRHSSGISLGPAAASGAGPSLAELQLQQAGGAAVVEGSRVGDAPSTQSVANTLWALATMELVPPRAWAEQVFNEVEVRLADFQPRELSNVLWAAATLGLVPPPSLMHRIYSDAAAQLLGSYPPQALSNTIWAIATLHRAAAPSPQSSRSSSAPLAPACVPPPARWASAFLAAVRAALPSMKDQEVSNTLWALSRLDITPDAALASAVIQHLACLERGSTRTPGPPAVGLEARARGGGGLSGQALANTLGALARLGFQLGGPAGEVVVRLVEAALMDEEAADPVTPLQRHRQRRRSGGVAEAGLRRLPGQRSKLQGCELAELMHALAKLSGALASQGLGLPPQTGRLLLRAVTRRLAPPSRLTHARQQQQRQQLPGSRPLLQPDELSRIIWATSALGLSPSRRWLAAFWAAAAPQLPAFAPIDLGQIVYALAKMGWNPAMAAGVTMARRKGRWRVATGKGRMRAALLLKRRQAAGVKQVAAAAAQARRGARGSTPRDASDAGRLTWRRDRVRRHLAFLGGRVKTVRQQLCASPPTQLPSSCAGLSTALCFLQHRMRRAGTTLARLNARLASHHSSSSTSASTSASATALSTQVARGPANSAAAVGTLPLPRAPASPPAPPPGLAELLSCVAAALPHVPGRDVANLSWGLAQMGVQPGQAWCQGILAETLVRRCAQLEGRHLASALWALARMGCRPKKGSLIMLESALYKRLPALKPRELAAIAWAFAAMRYTPNVEWLDEFAQQCMLVVAEFTLMDWAVVVRSLAAIVEQEQDAVIYLEDLFISPQIEANIHKFPPSSLATFVHACGVLGTRSGRLLGRLLSAARPQMAAFSAQELTALVCTAARLRFVPQSGFMSAWLEAFEQRMCSAEGFHGGGLAAVAWALATLGVRPRYSWQLAYTRVLTERCADLKPKHASMVVWALSEWQRRGGAASGAGAAGAQGQQPSAVVVDGPLLQVLQRLVARSVHGNPGFRRALRGMLSGALMRLRTKRRAVAAREAARAAPALEAKKRSVKAAKEQRRQTTRVDTAKFHVRLRACKRRAPEHGPAEAPRAAEVARGAPASPPAMVSS